MDQLGVSVQRAMTQYDKAYNQLVEGKGNIVNRTEKLKKLGAKTNKKLSQKILGDTRIKPVVQ